MSKASPIELTFDTNLENDRPGVIARLHAAMLLNS